MVLARHPAWTRWVVLSDPRLPDDPRLGTESTVRRIPPGEASVDRRLPWCICFWVLVDSFGAYFLVAVSRRHQKGFGSQEPRMPLRWAIAAAWTRLVAWSLRRIEVTWTLAVLGLMYSRAPIWALVRPSTSSRRTSSSRSVRP